MFMIKNQTFTYAQALQFAKWLHWAIYFRDEAAREVAKGNHEWAKMVRGMMRSNALNAMWVVKAQRIGGHIVEVAA